MATMEFLVPQELPTKRNITRETNADMITKY